MIHKNHTFAGLKDAEIEFGACRSKDPCKESDCPAYAECVENRQVCLTIMHKPCRQYQCSKYLIYHPPLDPQITTNPEIKVINKIVNSFSVNMTSNCPVREKSACSTESRSFPSICHLLKSKSTLSYRGRCMEGCQSTPVCGINGVSYRNECEAWSGKLSNRPYSFVRTHT